MTDQHERAAATQQGSCGNVAVLGCQSKGALRVDTAFWIRNGEPLEKRSDAWAPPICMQQTDEDEEDVDYKGRPALSGQWGNLHSVQSQADADKATSHSHHHHSKPDVH